jgi:methyl-accepting chemotaxis protein/methyl-accepting chemotaxis protein-1 (serine sensor receptor)
MIRFGVRGKLMVSVGILALGYLLFLVMVQWTGQTTQQHLDLVAGSVYPAAIEISHAQAGFRKLGKDSEAAAMLQDKAALNLLERDRQAVLDELAKAALEMAFDPSMRNEVDAAAQAFSKQEEIATAAYGKMIDSAGAISAETQASIISINRGNQEVDARFDRLSKTVGDKAFHAQLDSVTAWNTRQRVMALAMFICALVVAVTTLVLMERQVSKPLRDVAECLAEGARHLSSSAAQVSSAGLSIAQGASLQAASLEETSASSEEISSMAKSSAADCRTTAGLVEVSHTKFGNANRELKDLVLAMNAIQVSSAKVSKVIKAIDQIAFKTNILALNAAVEAARAGEAGAGFAVVAEEVRSLAAQCSTAARDSAEIVEESLRNSEEGKARLDLVTASIEAVTVDSLRIKELVDQINTASTQQTGGIAQISRAISAMERVTQTSVATSEESASAAEDLTGQSHLLQDAVASLGSIVGGAKIQRKRRKLRNGAQKDRVVWPRNPDGTLISAAGRGAQA